MRWLIAFVISSPHHLKKESTNCLTMQLQELVYACRVLGMLAICKKFVGHFACFVSSNYYS